MPKRSFSYPPLTLPAFLLPFPFGSPSFLLHLPPPPCHFHFLSCVLPHLPKSIFSEALGCGPGGVVICYALSGVRRGGGLAARELDFRISSPKIAACTCKSSVRIRNQIRQPSCAAKLRAEKTREVMSYIVAPMF